MLLHATLMKLIYVRPGEGEGKRQQVILPTITAKMPGTVYPMTKLTNPLITTKTTCKDYNTVVN